LQHFFGQIRVPPGAGLDFRLAEAAGASPSNVAVQPQGGHYHLSKASKRRDQMKISQAFRFEAAHHLPQVPLSHRCHRMHGHSYRVEVQLQGPVDQRTGFVADFFDVEAAFGPLLNTLDHHCLNDVAGLENPTAENIAIWIWDRIKPALPALSEVRVYETADCWAEYNGG
jgi:6-pyruvoyltetrahydropterin/6-carboxytetrahydropterin synthase